MQVIPAHLEKKLFPYITIDVVLFTRNLKPHQFGHVFKECNEEKTTRLWEWSDCKKKREEEERFWNSGCSNVSCMSVCVSPLIAQTGEKVINKNDNFFTERARAASGTIIIVATLWRVVESWHYQFCPFKWFLTIGFVGFWIIWFKCLHQHRWWQRLLGTWWWWHRVRGRPGSIEYVTL